MSFDILVLNNCNQCCIYEIASLGLIEETSGRVPIRDMGLNSINEFLYECGEFIDVRRLKPSYGEQWKTFIFVSYYAKTWITGNCLLTIHSIMIF